MELCARKARARAPASLVLWVWLICVVWVQRPLASAAKQASASGPLEIFRHGCVPESTVTVLTPPFPLVAAQVAMSHGDVRRMLSICQAALDTAHKDATQKQRAAEEEARRVAEEAAAAAAAAAAAGSGAGSRAGAGAVSAEDAEIAALFADTMDYAELLEAAAARSAEPAGTSGARCSCLNRCSSPACPHAPRPPPSGVVSAVQSDSCVPHLFAACVDWNCFT